MSLGGMFGGLAFGCALALLLELRDTSFHREKDVIRSLGAPLVLGIPLIPTRSETRRQKILAAYQWVAASALVLVVMVAELYVYKRG